MAVSVRYLVSVLLVCSALLWQHVECQTRLCDSVSPCVFNCDVITQLDLTPLSRSDNKPVFNNILDPAGAWFYDFSPCSNFTEGHNCNNTSVCRKDPLGPTSYNLGTSQNVKLTQNLTTNVLSLTYTATTANITRTTIVTLVCANATTKHGPLGELTVASGEGDPTYTMTLSSQYACLEAVPTGTTEQTPSTPAISTASDNGTTANIPTTEPPQNVTTEPLTTPAVANATTEPLTTPVPSNATTEPLTTPAATNVTTEPMSSPASNTTVTTEPPAPKTAPTTVPDGTSTTLKTTTPSHADNIRSSFMVVMTMMVVLMINKF